MKLMSVSNRIKRSSGVTGTSTALKIAESGRYSMPHSSPGILARTARIAGYGFIFIGIVAGAVAVLTLLVGGLLVLPCILGRFRSAYTRSLGSRKLRVVS